MDFEVSNASSAMRRIFSATNVLHVLATLALLLASPRFGLARNKEKLSYGEGLIINIPEPEPEVEQVVADVAQNGIIRGTKEYNKDQYVAGAIGADTSDVFPEWTEGGKVFYKVRMHAIDPINFKETNDVGTLVVRYIVQPQGDKNTLLRIDALFQEDFRKVNHPSNGTVESEEYKDIREHIESIELMKRQNLEAQARRQQILGNTQNSGPGSAPAMQSSSRDTSADAESSPVNTATRIPVNTRSENSAVDDSSQPGQLVPGQTAGQAAGQTLEQRLKDLRKQVERVVKSPGAPLKTAPFHTASTLVLLNPGAEVLIVINTPYWYGVETHEGQHGWIMRDQLEEP